jgi:hypothetical protein
MCLLHKLMYVVAVRKEGEFGLIKKTGKVKKNDNGNCTSFHSQMIMCQVGKLSSRMVNPKSATSISLGYEKVDYTSATRQQEDAVSKAFNDGSFLTSQTKLDTNVKKGRFN